MSKKRKRPKPTMKRIISVVRMAKAELERLQSTDVKPSFYPVWRNVRDLLADLEANEK